MLFKNKIVLPAALLLCAGLAACDKGSSNDPSTNDQSEFNPPGLLQTVTGDGKIELRWIGANAEKEFQGYHVFGAKTTVDEVKSLATFPSGADISAGASIPRCKDNNELFAKFGFAATETECETSISKAKEKAETITAGKDFTDIQFSAVNLLADDDLNTGSGTTPTESEEPITFNLKCEGESSTSVSRAAADGKAIGVQSCVVSTLSDGTALANGETYTFFVVAVKGAKFNNISWISNLVQDTPAKNALSTTLTLDQSKFVKLTIDPTTFAVTAADQVACTDNVCKITTTNGTAGTALYLGRDNTSATYKQRLIVSSTGSIKIQARGPQTYDPTKPDDVSASIPGDQATTSYASAGTKFAVYGNQVFDIQLTSGSNINYGKLVVSSITYADNASNTSQASVAVTVIMQPKTGSVDYWQ